MSLCPKCGAAMEEHEIGRFPAERCLECKGLWWDCVALDAALGRCGNARISTRIQQLMNDPGSANTDFPCPQCRLRTLKSFVHEGIEVDWCPTCRGIHLDDTELEALKARRTSHTAGTSGDVSGAVAEVGLDGLELVVEALIGMLDI